MTVMAYLDHNATAPVKPEVAERFPPPSGFAATRRRCTAPAELRAAWSRMGARLSPLLLA